MVASSPFASASPKTPTSRAASSTRWCSELWDDHRGEHLGGVTTILSADDVDAGRALLREVVEGLEAGTLEPTAGALEPLADSLPPQ